jgi:hypothetical protein
MRHLTLIVMLAYAANFPPNLGSKSSLTKVQIPSNKWLSLSDTKKAIWDRLDDQAKAIFLVYVPPTNTNATSRPPFAKAPFMLTFTGKHGFEKTSPGTKINLHEISAYDFLLANIHALKSSKNIDPNDKPVDPPPEDDPPDTRLINAAKSNGKPNPFGHICCVKSKSSMRHVNLVQSQYYVSFHDSITINNLSLIDHGENGGVAGE